MSDEANLSCRQAHCHSSQRPSVCIIGTEYFNKGAKTMNYTKPQIVALGKADHVIEAVPPVKGSGTYDGMVNGHSTFVNAAYDLDE
jgi:hypothetical protein